MNELYNIHIYKNGKGTTTETRKTLKGAAALLKKAKHTDNVTRVTVEIVKWDDKHHTVDTLIRWELS